MDSGFASFSDNKLELPKLPLDPAFGDMALARLFALPSRISKEQWKTIAEQVGASTASLAEPVPAKPAAPAVPAAAPSLNDLLARLGHLETQRKEATAISAEKEKAAPSYCSLFDWKKALALVQETPETEAGAHRRKLAASFAAALVSQPAIEYARIAAQQVDADGMSLDGKPIELDVTEMRDSSTNPSVFPAGTDKSNYAASTVTAVDSPTRTRIAIVVKLDTAAYKALDRMNSMDKIRIRGTAHVKLDSGYVSILVDSAALAD